MTESNEKTLLEAIRSHSWYQSIPLGDGTLTDGETGTSENDKLKMMALDNLAGKSVLDIGCNEGFYSFELEARGASPVLAIDKHPGAKEKFGLIKQLRNSKVEFKDIDFYDLKASTIGQFDIVLFLAVFHHLRYPVLAIDRLFELTAETLLIEVVEALPRSREDQAVLVRKLGKKKNRFHMLPTRRFLTDILTRAGFARIELMGTHRFHELREHRGTPGYDQQRVLLKAAR